MRRFVYTLITGEGANRLFLLLSKPLLFFLSFIYINAVRLIKFFYKINLLKSIRPESKVISVGNITWGGTGKTSLVALISRFLNAKDRKAAILIRGYGADEDKMLKEQVSTLVLSGKNRVKNVKKAEDKHNADILILDDGFQHWRIKRDLDIVTINATDPFGNGAVIPAGILREPLPALKRADIIILTKVNLLDEENIAGIKNIISDIAPEAEIFEAEHWPVSLTETSEASAASAKPSAEPVSNREYGLDYIAGKKICAVAAIGDNNSFFRMLLDLDTKIMRRFFFPDHHRYTQRDIKDIIDAAKDTNSDAIITTAKDWMRLKTYFSIRGGVRHLEGNSRSHCLTPPPSVLLLNIAVKVKGEEKFFTRLSTLLSS